MRHFFTRLDDPEQRESHYAVDEGRFVRVALPKVYHINLIARVSTGGRRILLKRCRIVLNKDGIVRLETALAEE
jgi:ribosomal protein S5